MAVPSTKLAFVTMVTMALLVMTNGSVGYNELKEVFNVEKEFDYFTLALSWSETYCAISSKCCEQNACCKKSNIPTGFVIRGLWPDYNNGSYPTCCQDFLPYEESEIKSLLPVLNKYMPALDCSLRKACNDQKRSHLAYQWEKHGTCTFPVLRSQYSYFLQTLHLFFRHNVTALLKEAGYGASSTESHSLEEISSTIKKAYGAKPLFTCTKFGAIKDVRLCFHKNFQIRDCAQASASASTSTSTSTSTCPAKVSLPTFTPPGRRVWTSNPLIEELGAL